MKKLVEYHPHLAPAFRVRCYRAHPPAHCRRLNRNGYKRSTIARVFPVFNLSSIVAHSYRGGDLIRWRHRGQVLHPQAFCRSSAPTTRLLLTAFVLQEAVQNINEHPGTFYFSVNIPSSLAASDSLLRMVEAARQQLRQPEGVERLVLEYAETIDFRRQSRSTAQVEELQRAGVRVMLDDCFSQGASSFRRVACTSMPINWI